MAFKWTTYQANHRWTLNEHQAQAQSICLKWLLTFFVGKSQSSAKSMDVLIVYVVYLLIFSLLWSESFDIYGLSTKSNPPASLNLQCELKTRVQVQLLSQQQHQRLMQNVTERDTKWLQTAFLSVWESCSCVGSVEDTYDMSVPRGPLFHNTSMGPIYFSLSRHNVDIRPGQAAKYLPLLGWG